MSFRNLYFDKREVGKTIKSTKIYYLWEFYLSEKPHKVELFHSIMSGKKKLCLDAQVLTEDKSYSANFNYSFKLENHYFNVIQMDSDNFEMRIDNKLFTAIAQEIRHGGGKEEKNGRGSLVNVENTKKDFVYNQRGSQIQVNNNVSTNNTSKMSFPSNLRSSVKNDFDEKGFEFEDYKPKDKGTKIESNTNNKQFQSNTQKPKVNNSNPGQNNVNVTKNEGGNKTGNLIDFGFSNSNETTKPSNTNNTNFNTNNYNQQPVQDNFKKNQNIINNMNFDIDMLKDTNVNNNLDDLNFGFEGNDKTIINIPPDINESNIYPRFSEIDRTNINDFTNMSNLNSQFGGQNFDEDFGFNSQFPSKQANYFGGQIITSPSFLPNNNNNNRQINNVNLDNNDYSKIGNNNIDMVNNNNTSNVNFNNNSLGNITMQNNSLNNNTNNNNNTVNENKPNEFKKKVLDSKLVNLDNLVGSSEIKQHNFSSGNIKNDYSNQPTQNNKEYDFGKLFNNGYNVNLNNNNDSRYNYNYPQNNYMNNNLNNNMNNNINTNFNTGSNMNNNLNMNTSMGGGNYNYPSNNFNMGGNINNQSMNNNMNNLNTMNNMNNMYGNQGGNYNLGKSTPFDL